MSFSSWQEQLKIQNVGLGFRACHYSYIVENIPSVPWFEIITENYLGKQGVALKQLQILREHYPLVFHGVSMSLGSTDPLNAAYLQQLKQLSAVIKPAYISDHLCWTSVNGEYFHELMPLPYTEETIKHVTARIQQVQDFLGQQILIENVSSYLNYSYSTMPEWEFLNAIAESADCFILLDLNNIYVSGQNHGFDPSLYINKINASRVRQFHLAGFLDCDTHLLDTHGAQVHPQVWSLYETALEQFGAIPTLIEWDNDIPSFPELLNEASKAQKLMDSPRLRPLDYAEASRLI
jgi:hypothetical protein